MNYARIGNEEGSCPDGATGANALNFQDDLAAINWFNTNVHGTPVIAEASVGIYRCDGSRFSISTGLPTIIGWDYHESQQRDNPDLSTRVGDVHTLYDTPDGDRKLSILRQYDVRYVVVGSIERHLVSSGGQALGQPSGHRRLRLDGRHQSRSRVPARRHDPSTGSCRPRILRPAHDARVA